MTAMSYGLGIAIIIFLVVSVKYIIDRNLADFINGTMASIFWAIFISGVYLILKRRLLRKQLRSEIESYKQAINDNPYDEKAHLVLGMLFLKYKDVHKAIYSINQGTVT